MIWTHTAYAKEVMRQAARDLLASLEVDVPESDAELDQIIIALLQLEDDAQETMDSDHPGLVRYREMIAHSP